MSIHELHDVETTQRFLAQGLWLQRLRPPTAATVKPALEWALEVAASGEPLLPIGFLADVGHLAFGADHVVPASRDWPVIPGLAAGWARAYEDHVLGRLDADGSFERAADAVRRYQGRDRARGLAFVLQQIRLRAGLGGVLVNPAGIKAALERPAAEFLARGWQTLSREGLGILLSGQYEELIGAVRSLGAVLGPEDIFELEHSTALAPFSQRVALRQVLQAATHLEAGLPRQRPQPRARRQDMPTRILDEDTYPVGGFASLATRGSIESLLHSQLAFMEQENRPDLFDLKYLRDELLYYARDENQFLRRRRTFVFALFPDLARARFKDAELPWQRIVLLLALLLVAVRQLTDWLTTDALMFEVLFLEAKDAETLAAEQELVQLLLREPIANGTVTLTRLPVAQLASWCAARARRSLCHCLTVATTVPQVQAEATQVASLQMDGPCPTFGLAGETRFVPEAADSLAGWGAVLEHLLQEWV